MGIQIVSFRCTLKDRLGRVLSSTVSQDVITQAPEGREAMLRGLSEGLRDLHKGERRNIYLRADQAYGFYHPEKVIMRGLDDIPDADNLKLGDTVFVEAAKGKRTAYRVTEIGNDQVELDGNHPLAGQDLIFEIETIEAREATPEEIRDAAEPETECPTGPGKILH